MSGASTAVSFNSCASAQGDGKMNEQVVYKVKNRKTYLCFTHAVEGVGRGILIESQIAVTGYYKTVITDCPVCEGYYRESAWKEID